MLSYVKLDAKAGTVMRCEVPPAKLDYDELLRLIGDDFDVVA